MQLFERDDFTCIVSGTEWAYKHPCFGGPTVQHAVARGMGSSAKYDSIDLLRTMCAGHNALETSNAEFQEACDQYGWSAPRWVADKFGPRAIPVLFPDGWHLLSNGSRIPISDSTAKAITQDVYDIRF